MINHRGKFLLTNNLAGGDVLDGAGKTRGLSIYGEAGIVGNHPLDRSNPLLGNARESEFSQ